MNTHIRLIFWGLIACWTCACEPVDPLPVEDPVITTSEEKEEAGIAVIPEPTGTLADTTRIFLLLKKVDQFADSAYQEGFELVGDVLSEIELIDGIPDSLVLRAMNLETELTWLMRDLTSSRASAMKAMEFVRQHPGPQTIDHADVFTNLAVLNRDENRFKEVEPLLRSALSILESLTPPPPDKLSFLYLQLADVMQTVGNDGAYELYEKAMTFPLPDPDQETKRDLTARENMAICLSMKGEYDQGLSQLEALIDPYRLVYGEHSAKMKYLVNNIGVVCWYMDDYPKALASFKQSAEIGEAIYPPTNSRHQLDYTNISKVYKMQGDLEHALDYAQKALNFMLSLDNPDPLGLASAYGAVGTFLLDKEEYVQAEEYLQQALSIEQQVLGAHPQTAYTHQFLGSLYYDQNHLGAAQEQFWLSYQMRLQTLDETHPDMAKSFSWLGEIAMNSGDYELAETYFLKAHRLYLQFHPVGHHNELNARTSLIQLMIRQGRLEEAYLELSAALSSTGYDPQRPEDFSPVVNNSGFRPHLDVWVEFFEAKWAASEEERFLDSMIYYDDLRLGLAQHLQTTFLSSGNRKFYASEARPAFEQAIATRVLRNEEGDLAKAFQIAEQTKSRELAEKMQFDERRSSFGLPDSILQREYDLGREIASAERQLFQQRFEADSSAARDSLIQIYENQKVSLRIQREDLQERIRREYPAYYRMRYSQEVIGMEDVQRQLGETHDALVEYLVGDSVLYTWVILPDTVVLLTKNLSANDLKGQVEAFRCQILAPSDMTVNCDSMASLDKLSHALYQQIFEEVDRLLPDQARILLVPDGVLGYVPFESLLTQLVEDDASNIPRKFLLRDHVISYAYSATLHREMEDRIHVNDPLSGVLAVAPDFGGTGYEGLLASRSVDTTDRRNLLSALTYNVPEAERIVERFGGELLTGEEATEEAFVERAGDYRILHLSTHGKANDQSGDYSFLAFHHLEEDSTEIENEWLYNQEIYSLELNADLVVLSACETGVGELRQGEGIISLARGFSYAGAKSLVTSLWNVNDRSSMELMDSFYGYLAEGMPKHLALRQAKLDYLDTHPDYLQSPFYWSGFIAIGDMSALAWQPAWIGWGIGFLILTVLISGFLLWKGRRRNLEKK